MRAGGVCVAQAAVQEGRPWNECRIEDPYSEVDHGAWYSLYDIVWCAVQANMMRVLAEPGHPNVVTLTEVPVWPVHLSDRSLLAR